MGARAHAIAKRDCNLHAKDSITHSSKADKEYNSTKNDVPSPTNPSYLLLIAAALMAWLAFKMFVWL
jgi:hypothetical protein